MRSFKDIHESFKVDKKLFTEFKAYIKKQDGYKYWKFEGDYQDLVIGFDSQENRDKTLEILKDKNFKFYIKKFGISAPDNKGRIIIELNKEAQKAL